MDPALAVFDLADEEAEEEEDVPPLIEAATRGDVAQVRTLLDQGADIEARDAHGWKALHQASQGGHREVVDLLLDRGGDIEAVNNAGSTPVMWASFFGHLEVVQLLHTSGGNIHHANADGANALHWAAWEDHLPVCEFLLSKGVDLMAATNNGSTALSRYGQFKAPALSPETKALRRAALEAAWAAGPHPSQVRRRRWESRGPLLWVLAEHGYRPLQLRAQAIAAAAVGAPLPVVQYSPKEDVLRSEGLVRYIISFL